MYIDDIRDSLRSVEQNMNTVSDKISNILEFTQNNKFIPPELCDEVTVLLDQITNAQNFISDCLKEHDELIPESIRETELLLSGMEKKDRCFMICDSIKNIKCSNEAHSELLKQLAEEVSSDDISALEIAEALIKDIKEGSFESLKSVNGISSSKYSNLILACMFKELSLSDETEEHSEIPGSDEADAAPQIPAPEQENSGNDDTDLPETISESDSEKETDGETPAPENTEEPDITAEMSQYSGYINDCQLDFSVNLNENIGEITVEEHPSASKSMSTSNLKNLLIKVNKSCRQICVNPTIRKILFRARHLGVNADYFIYEGNFKKVTYSYIQNFIDYLYNKGILKKLSLAGFPDIYVPTANAEKLYTKESLINFICPTKEYASSWSCSSEDISSSPKQLMAAHILHECFGKGVIATGASEYNWSTGQSDFNNTPYANFKVDDFPLQYIYSFLPQDPQDVIKALLDVKTLFENNENRVLIIVTSDRVYGEELCGLITKEPDRPEYLRLFIYDNEKLYDYDAKTEIEFLSNASVTESALASDDNAADISKEAEPEAKAEEDTATDIDIDIDTDINTDTATETENEEADKTAGPAPLPDESGSVNGITDENAVAAKDETTPKESKETSPSESISESAPDTNDEQVSDNPSDEDYIISESEVKGNVINFIQNEKVYCLLAYLKSLSNNKNNKNIEALYNCTAYAYNDPMFRVKYNSDDIISIMSSTEFIQDDLYKFFIYAAALRNFFSNDCQIDHSMIPLEQTLAFEPQELRHLALELIKYKNFNHCGVEAVCDCAVREQIKYKELLEHIRNEAKEWYHTMIELPFRGEIKIKRFKDTMESIFNKSNDIATCLEIVINDEYDDMDIVADFLGQFMKSDEISEKNISSSNIFKYIDNEWKNCCQSKVMYHSENLKSGLKSKIINKVRTSVSILARWVHLHNTNNSDVKVISPGNKETLLRLIDSAIQKCCELSGGSKETAVGMNCILYTLNEFKEMIEGSFSIVLRNKYFYIDFLKDDNVTLIEDEKSLYYIPDLRNYCKNIEGVDIISRIMNHSTGNLAFPLPKDFEKPEKCNLGSLDCLIDFYKDILSERSFISDMKYPLPYDNEQFEELVKQKEFYKGESKQVRSNIEQEHKKFIERIELAQSYGKFDVTDDSKIKKETIQNHIYDMFKTVVESENYGFYRFAMRIIEDYIDEQAKKYIPVINKRLDDILTDEKWSDPDIPKADKEKFDKYVNKIRQYINICNFTAAEDLINRVKNDDIHDNIYAYFDLADTLADFHNQYERIHRLTWDASVRMWNEKISRPIERYVINTASARKDESGGLALIKKWIKGKGTKAHDVSDLLAHLGLNAKVEPLTVDYAKKKEVDYFDCRLKNSGENKTEYPHIVAPFGSEAYQTSFRVACFYGAFTKTSILAQIREMSSYQKNTIIFIDYAFKENDRRELAKELRKIHYNEVYLVVDRIAITYLAAHYQKSTIVSQLMTLCMPFSFYQPYVPDSGNPMPPEMFVGRSKELSDIKNIKGPNMLYGGRQLGKSALLKKAAADVDGNGRSVAVYVDIKESNVAEAAKMISRAFILKGIFKQKEEFEDWNELTYCIETKIKEQKIEYLLLLIDEGDAFIADSRNNKYYAIDCLKKLSTNNRHFKYVIAGLHNLVRFHLEGALDDNASIPHLNTLTIKPFKFSEAKQLLEYPLSTLGIFFRQDDISDGLISNILATTNYFPGLIQFYCSQVVESLCYADCPCYENPDAPPYYVTEAQIQKILANEEFNQKIKEKFRITLRLDKDFYYDIIALSMAWLCFENGIGAGYSAQDVHSVGKEYHISKIVDLQIENLTMFMDELVDLNILRRSSVGKYVFSRRNFIRLVGTHEEVFEKLLNYQTE